MEPLTTQPTGYNDPKNWSNLTSVRELELFAHLDQLIIVQHVEVLEALTAWEARNRYRVENSMGQTILHVEEGQSSLCMRQCCGPARGFTMHITNNQHQYVQDPIYKSGEYWTNKDLWKSRYGIKVLWNVNEEINQYDCRKRQEIMRVTREFKCCAGCCWCADGRCGFEIKVEAPAGNVIGSVRQHSSGCAPHYRAYDEYYKHILTMWGPKCVYQDCCLFNDDVNVNVMTPDQHHNVGVIFKRWNGCCQEMLYRNRFVVKFPMDMDVKAKALLFGTVFLFDFMFFEYKNNK